jgi:ACR3 family arsenite efflux pump ArsB
LFLAGGLQLKNFRFRSHWSAKVDSTVPTLTVFLAQRGEPMLQQLWDSFVLLIPVFFLLTLIFGAGFYIGRVSKRE